MGMLSRKGNVVANLKTTVPGCTLSFLPRCIILTLLGPTHGHRDSLDQSSFFTPGSPQASDAESLLHSASVGTGHNWTFSNVAQTFVNRAKTVHRWELHSEHGSGLSVWMGFSLRSLFPKE